MILDMPSLTLATWNVNGLRARATQFLEWLGRDRPRVVCLQEIKSKPEQLPPEVHDAAGYWWYWHGAGGYSGVALGVSKEIAPERPLFAHPAFDHETRIVTADLGELLVASVYVPNGGKDYPAKLGFLTRLAAWAKQLHDEGREVVLCGDINIAHADIDVHPRERKAGVIGQRTEERELFDKLLGEHFVDVGRAMQPDNADLYTWWPPWRNMRQRNIGWRIDYILASRGVAARATSCVVLADVGTSDHAPVMMTIA